MAEVGGNVKLWSIIAMVMWLGGFHINFIVGILCLVHLPSPWAITILAIWVTLMFLPAEYDTPMGSKVARFIVTHAKNYFPIKVIFEDESAFDPNQSYVIAAEPHSVLPIGIVVLTPQSGILPVNNLRALASSAVFWSPVVRHIWTWLGVAPVSRKSFTAFLQKGISCIVVPGGVQECLFMEDHREVVFLKQRYGFVRIAMEAGSPLVPTFCFGQRNAYKWWKPTGKWYNQLSRAIGFTPLVFWGRYGGPVPYRTPMYYVVGKPIPVPKTTNPSQEEVSVILGQFIEALEALFEKHKGSLEFEDDTLLVY
ncbi:diacylglycerol O-acyltransferase 2 [Physcomitrium patens]|uniref:Acyltransferase n=1 Tax=Physcomitrium patens TaxID=3218 RepID=A9TGI4_PHYPA|nr:diacylglycerol O-acyltransferase 2-like [Physcomitrium patens]PNR31060.1 hypothetical protein PHYPA_027376 [Physcomitrium patens]|eukprot:XP_024360450.1 diacylglycerol O-acyltransferase 2-like [Physcomitrella patens]